MQIELKPYIIFDLTGNADCHLGDKLEGYSAQDAIKRRYGGAVYASCKKIGARYAALELNPTTHSRFLHYFK